MPLSVPDPRRTLVAAMLGGCLAAGPAAAFNKGQELMILTLHSAALASQHCPYRLDEGKLQGFLSRKGLTRAALTGGGFSPLLRKDMAADDQRYAADTAAACDQAWASFGPDSPLGGLLRAK